MIDAFLQLTTADGAAVEGECSDQDFPKAIEIRGFGLGAKASGPGLDISGASDGGIDTGGKVDSAVDKAMADLKQTAFADLKREQTKFQQIQAAIAKQLKAQVKKTVEDITKSQQSRRAGDKLDTPVDLRAQVANELQEKAGDGDAQTDRLTFQFRKDVDAASADLFQAYCSTVQQPLPNPEHRKFGRFRSAVVSLRRAGGAAGPGAKAGKPFLICKFEDLAISAYEFSFEDSRGHVAEEITFTFTKYTFEYETQDATGEGGAARPSVSGTLSAKDGGSG